MKQPLNTVVFYSPSYCFPSHSPPLSSTLPSPFFCLPPFSPPPPLFSLVFLPFLFSLIFLHPPFPHIISLFLMILIATSMFPLSESLARTTLLNTPCPVYPYTVYRRSSCSPMRTPVKKSKSFKANYISKRYEKNCLK